MVYSEKKSEVALSCPNLCDLMDSSLPGSSVRGIFQARVLEWAAISYIYSYFIGYHSYALSIFNCISFLFIDTLQTGSWPFNSFIYVSSLYLLFMVFSQMHIELRAEWIKGWVNICFVKFVLKLSFVVLMTFLTLMVLHSYVLLACISWSLLVYPLLWGSLQYFLEKLNIDWKSCSSGKQSHFPHLYVSLHS